MLGKALRNGRCGDKGRCRTSFPAKWRRSPGVYFNTLLSLERGEDCVLHLLYPLSKLSATFKDDGAHARKKITSRHRRVGTHGRVRPASPHRGLLYPFGTMSEPPRKRAKLACVTCNARRIKCDVTNRQPCGNCLATNSNCETRESKRGKHPRRPRVTTEEPARRDSV